MSQNPSPSLLDAAQIVKRVYEEDDDAIRVKPIAGSLVTELFDAITVTYPSSTVEVYAYRTGGVSGSIVATVTVTYTTSTKDVLTSVVRT